MHLPSGIKVFWPLITCTPRLNMFGELFSLLFTGHGLKHRMLFWL
ncbi:hypothetical protein PDIG_49300 [Penicillium digitatum PHI26]|uniref:Uncharacterized protein n=2 Tax=Penicillium digitatum TaxID=36651 RepID=K9FQW6_PEND2|nr:hypothetical protein PDIG_49300 [Penicillium digitatum PHI26]